MGESYGQIRERLGRPAKGRVHEGILPETAEIPCDYDGVMGVPITFLDKYNPEQCEIIWTTDRGGDGMLEDLKLPHTRYDAPLVKGKGQYKRILIRRRKSAVL